MAAGIIEQAPALEPQHLNIDRATSAFESLLNPEQGEEEAAPEETAGEEDNPKEPSKEPSPEEEGDEQDAEDPETDSEEDAPDEQETDTLYTVKVDGEEKQVPAAELIAGYQRNADYTRKTQQLAAERQATAAEVEAARAEREQNARVAEALLARLSEVTPPEPDWMHLRATDPIEFAARWAQKQMADQEQATLRMVLEQRQADQRKAEAEKLEADLKRESEQLLSAIPEWSDPEKARADRTALKSYGMKQGFTSDDLDGVFDHRIVLVLRKAMMYDALQERRPQVKKHIEAAPPVPPGVKKRVTTDLTRHKQRLAQTGRVEDAALAFESLL
jgi:hypothetical protein